MSARVHIRKCQTISSRVYLAHDTCIKQRKRATEREFRKEDLNNGFKAPLSPTERHREIMHLFSAHNHQFVTTTFIVRLPLRWPSLRRHVIHFRAKSKVASSLFPENAFHCGHMCTVLGRETTMCFLWCTTLFIFIDWTMTKRMTQPNINGQLVLFLVQRVVSSEENEQGGPVKE